jgi:predicted nucleotidyltransferase
MKPSEALRLYRTDIRRVVALNNASNPRIFGSALHGDDADDSDLDLLVDPIEGKTTLTSLVRIKREIEALTGVTTDVLTPMALHERFRQMVLAEAVPI